MTAVELELNLGDLGVRRVLVEIESSTAFGGSISIQVNKILLEVGSTYKFECHDYGPKHVVDILPMMSAAKVEALKGQVWSKCFMERTRGPQPAGEATV